MSLIDTVRYASDELRENWRDRMWWRHRIGARVIGPFHTNVYPTRRGSTYVLDGDWDVLIVLDACRADLFEEVVDTDRFDAYRRIKSPGSRTPEWSRENFRGHELGDVVYVASNGFATTVLGDTFHEIVKVWEGVDGVPTPSDMTEAARTAHEEYLNKRLIVHYLQPHRPFLHSDIGFDETIADNPWRALGNGRIDRDIVWELYRENLERVFQRAFELADELPGRAVITSDHGNLVGERTYPIPIRLYGHPEGVRHPGLVEVPWAVLEDESRPRIVDDGLGSVSEADETIRAHLEDLGYVDR